MLNTSGPVPVLMAVSILVKNWSFGTAVYSILTSGFSFSNSAISFFVSSTIGGWEWVQYVRVVLAAPTLVAPIANSATSTRMGTAIRLWFT
ncbi:MAG: hypothetical protein BWY85_01914 [Firmicutes bacterium ADurb.Bin506]|nr:MAG: hypothetical protein BWY85_01914 [Firmicutes bacterium ADurb.Bin506]